MVQRKASTWFFTVWKRSWMIHRENGHLIIFRVISQDFSLHPCSFKFLGFYNTLLEVEGESWKIFPKWVLNFSLIEWFEFHHFRSKILYLEPSFIFSFLMKQRKKNFQWSSRVKKKFKILNCNEMLRSHL